MIIKLYKEYDDYPDPIFIGSVNYTGTKCESDILAEISAIYNMYITNNSDIDKFIQYLCFKYHGFHTTECNECTLILR